MGQPAAGDCGTAQSAGRTRGTETSHYPEEKKTKVIAQVVASERAAAQTASVATRPRGCRAAGKADLEGRGTSWKGRPQRVKAPYPAPESEARRYLSSAGHEKSGVNRRGPSRKAKYYRETDSEPVP